MLVRTLHFFCFVLFFSGLPYSLIIILSLVLIAGIFNATVKLINLQLLRIYFWDKYSPPSMSHGFNVNYHFLYESYANFSTF